MFKEARALLKPVQLNDGEAAFSQGVRREQADQRIKSLEKENAVLRQAVEILKKQWLS